MSKALLIVHILNLRIKFINCICNIYSYKPKPTTGFPNTVNNVTFI